MTTQLKVIIIIIIIIHYNTDQQESLKDKLNTRRAHKCIRINEERNNTKEIFFFQEQKYVTKQTVISGHISLESYVIVTGNTHATPED